MSKKSQTSSIAQKLAEVVKDSISDQEREAAEDFEDWGWNADDLTVTQTEPTVHNVEVDEDYTDVDNSYRLPTPSLDTGSSGDPDTGTHGRKRDLTVGEFASLAEDRGERGWTQDEWKEWWTESQTEKQALEISDYYRVWIKDKDDAPESVDVHSAEEASVPAPADNTHYYDVPFKVSSAMVPIGEAEKAVESRPDREEFPTMEDLHLARVPHTDTEVAKAATVGFLQKITPSTLTDVHSPLTLSYGVYRTRQFDGSMWRHTERLFKQELADRGVVAITRQMKTRVVSNPSRINKYKVYVDSEEEVPEEYEPITGPQGGIHYEVNTDDDEDEKDGDDVGDTVGDLEFGGFGVVDFEGSVGEALQENNIGEGDKLYVEHPKDPNYIAEVDDVTVDPNDPDMWEVSFGNGSYTLREDTSSQPVGEVTEQPDISAHSDVESIAGPSDVTDKVETGDTISYTDPAGYEHYHEVEAWTQSGDIYAGEDQVIPREDVDGVVVTSDPLEKYEFPDEEKILSETNLGEDRVQGAITFNENLAKVTEEGDATQIPSYNYRDFAGSIFDEDLAIEAYKTLLNNDPTKTQRSRMEQRMRNLGLDPKQYQPREYEFNPDEVPESRQNTTYSNFDSERATNAVAYAIQSNDVTSNEAAWTEFFDMMTQAELEEGLKLACSNSLDRDGYGSHPMDSETEDFDVQEKEPHATKIRDAKNLSACWSRLEGDTDDLVQLANEVIDDAPESTQRYVSMSAATWIDDADARREIFEDRLDGDFTELPSKHRARFEMQFADSHDVRGRQMLDRYTSSTTSENTQFSRAVAKDYDISEAASRHNRGVAADSVEPTEELDETIQIMRDKTSELIEEKYDGEVTLYRGIDNPVSANASLESWSDDATVSDSGMFDNHAVLEAKLEPGDVLACHEISQHNTWAYGGYGEKEWTVFGGSVAQEVPDDMNVEEVFGKPEEMDYNPSSPKGEYGAY